MPDAPPPPRQLTIIIPTRGRADRLPGLIANIRQTTPPVYLIVFLVDCDDRPTWKTLAGFEYRNNPLPEHAPGIGDVCVLNAPTGRIAHFVNYGVRTVRSPYFFMANDDVVFRDGWWQAARAAMTEGIGVVGVNDLHNKEVLAGRGATFPLVSSDYVDAGAVWGEPPGGVYFEGYSHDGTDRELAAYAIDRGAFAYAPDAVVEHLHPIWNGRPEDETDRTGQLVGKERDAEIFAMRRDAWRAEMGQTLAEADAAVG